jgi:EpsD family peptidyl-prolyl cis-trans isomerase
MTQASDFSTGHPMRQRIFVAIVFALVASSCQKKAEGQTVAIVNNEEITATELNAELSANGSGAVGDTKEARAAALQRLIDRKLVVQQARKDGIDKSPEFLNQQRRMTEDLLISMLVSRQANISQVPSAAEIDKFKASRPEVFANREVWTLEQLLFPIQKDPALSAKLNATKTLDEVAQLLTANHVQFTRSTRKVDTAIFPHAIYQQIANLPANEPFIVPGATQAVASVITQREPVPVDADQARQLALNLMKRENVQKIIQDRVKGLRGTAKIEYQPGFGPPKG